MKPPKTKGTWNVPDSFKGLCFMDKVAMIAVFALPCMVVLALIGAALVGIYGRY